MDEDRWTAVPKRERTPIVSIIMFVVVMGTFFVSLVVGFFGLALAVAGAFS